MKFPVSFRIMIFFALLSGIFLTWFGYVNVRYFSNPLYGMKISDLVIEVFFMAAGLWNITASITWTAGSRYSYHWLYTSAIAVISVLIILMYQNPISPLDMRMIDLAAFLLFLLYPLVLLVIAFLPSTRSWALSHGGKIRFLFNPVILVLFVLLMATGPSYLLIRHNMGREELILYGTVKASSSNSIVSVSAATDGNMETAWKPELNPSGVNEWIEITTGISGWKNIVMVELYPGAYSHDDSTVFIKYNRIRSGYILFSDGSKIPFWFEDRAVMQRVRFEPRSSSRIRLVITDVYRGRISDALQVPEIRFVKRVKYYDRPGAL